MADFDLRTAPHARLLRVNGPLAHGDCTAFRGALERVTNGASTGPVIVDLSGLEFICSAAMSLLVQYERSLAKAGRRMVTAGMCGTVRETVEMCGIDELLTTSPTVEDALAGLAH